MDWIEKVVEKTSSGCWEWTGSRLTSGYGVLTRNGAMTYVHREVYFAVSGSSEVDKMVCHKCDNPPCCNPEHLFLGTHQDNMSDKVKKGRQPKGESHWNSKFTLPDIAKIRDDPRSNRKIALEFGVTDCAIGLIKRGKRWALS